MASDSEDGAATAVPKKRNYKMPKRPKQKLSRSTKKAAKRKKKDDGTATAAATAAATTVATAARTPPRAGTGPSSPKRACTAPSKRAKARVSSAVRQQQLEESSSCGGDSPPPISSTRAKTTSPGSHLPWEQFEFMTPADLGERFSQLAADMFGSPGKCAAAGAAYSEFINGGPVADTTVAAAGNPSTQGAGAVLTPTTPIVHFPRKRAAFATPTID